jgi:hypothetical protein
MENQSDPSNNPSNLVYWVGGFITVVGLLLVLDSAVLDGLKPLLRLDHPRTDQCLDIVQSGATLSRARLVQLLEIPAQTRREHLLPILQNPYCQLPAVTTSSGVTLERDAYPLEFDPSVWLVVRYDRGSYVDYEFIFR